MNRTHHRVAQGYTETVLSKYQKKQDVKTLKD